MINKTLNRNEFINLVRERSDGIMRSIDSAAELILSRRNELLDLIDCLSVMNGCKPMKSSSRYFNNENRSEVFQKQESSSRLLDKDQLQRRLSTIAKRSQRRMDFGI